MATTNRSKKHERQSNPHESPSKPSQLESELLAELKLLQEEFSLLQRETAQVTQDIKEAPPQAAAAAVNPLNQVLETVTGLIPIVGPLLALL